MPCVTRSPCATTNTAEVTRKRHNWAMAELAVGEYEQLRLLEDSLWRAETRFDRDYMGGSWPRTFVNSDALGVCTAAPTSSRCPGVRSRRAFEALPTADM